MIIFGYRGFAKILAMVSLVCSRCGNPAAHQLVKRSRWFTLFFIPVIPLYFSHTITCTFCGAQTKVSKQDADQMLANSGQGGAQGVQPGQPQYAPHGQPPQGPQPYAQQAYGQPQGGQQPYGSPQFGQAPYGSPQFGAPQYGSPQYGSPQYGQAPAEPPYDHQSPGAPQGRQPWSDPQQHGQQPPAQP